MAAADSWLDQLSPVGTVATDEEEAKLEEDAVAEFQIAFNKLVQATERGGEVYAVLSADQRGAYESMREAVIARAAAGVPVWSFPWEIALASVNAAPWASSQGE